MTDHIDDFIEYQKEIQIIPVDTLDEAGDTVYSETSPTTKTVILIQATAKDIQFFPEGADLNGAVFVWDKEKIMELDQAFLYQGNKYIVIGIDDYKVEENLYRFRGAMQ